MGGSETLSRLNKRIRKENGKSREATHFNDFHDIMPQNLFFLPLAFVSLPRVIGRFAQIKNIRKGESKS